jgi:predicted deacylase
VGTLSDRGIPSIVAESGYLSTYNEPEIAVHVNGARNVMRHFGLLEGKPEFTRSHDPLMMTENWVAYASRGGVFHPQVKPGDRVQAGQVIALIKDVFGEIVEEIKSPKTGRVRIQHPRRVVNSGNPVFRGWANPS